MSVLGHRLRAIRADTFDPLTAFTWDLVYWANDPDWSNPGDGNAVTTWRDASGNSRTGTASSAPIYRASKTALNNRAAVEFDGGSDQMDSPSFTINQPYSWVIVFANHTNADGRLLSSGVNVQLFRNNSAPPSSFGCYAGLIGASTGNLANNVGGLLSSYFSGANSFLVLNGTQTATANAGTFAMTLLRVATRNNDLRGIFDAAFIGVYSGDFHAHANYPAFKSWVASYYGLSIA